MAIVVVVTELGAPVERCFDLARSIDLHLASVSSTEERAVGGVVSGLIGLGEEVTWEARHFGVRQRLTSKITSFDRPLSFTDTMQRGAFSRFAHEHLFEPTPMGTRMTDRLRFASPLGPLGRLADHLVLGRYLTRFLEVRNAHLKEVAESDAWRRFLPV